MGRFCISTAELYLHISVIAVNVNVLLRPLWVEISDSSTFFCVQSADRLKRK